MSTEAQGSKARLFAKDGSGTVAWDSGTVKSFPFYRESMRKVTSVVHPQVITGDRDEHGERARQGPSLYYGQLVFGVSPSELAFWAPYYLGGTPAGTSYPIGNTLNPFAIYIDKVTTKFAFYDCYIDKCLIVGRQNGPGGAPNFLTMALTIYALSYISTPATTASAAIPTITGDYVPLVFEDCVLTLKSSTRQTKQFAVLHDNFLKQRYVNSIEPQISYPLHRQLKLQTRHPFDTGTSALDDVALSASAAATLAATNGTVSATWNMTLAQLVSQTPVVSGKTEVDLVSNYAIRASGSTASYSLTIDSTV
jgi:hypothetical protein